MKLYPRNWADFQHYKGRSPPWIKFHRGLLDDYDFQCLPIASKALAPMLWLLASESKDPKTGEIDASGDRLSFRLRMSAEDVAAALKPLIDKGFFFVKHGASNVLADCKQHAPLEETETETEGEKEKELPSSTGEKRAEEPSPDPIFGTGLALLIRKGVGEKSARSFLGMFRKTCGDDLVAAELLVKAEVDDVSDPVAWLTKAARTRQKVVTMPPPKPEPIKASHRPFQL